LKVDQVDHNVTIHDRWTTPHVSPHAWPRAPYTLHRLLREMNVAAQCCMTAFRILWRQ